MQVTASRVGQPVNTRWQAGARSPAGVSALAGVASLQEPCLASRSSSASSPLAPIAVAMMGLGASAVRRSNKPTQQRTRRWAEGEDAKAKPPPATPTPPEISDEELFANDGVEDEFDPTIQVGATEPFGYFDPLGLSFREECDKDTWRYWRAAEIKHGRVAMVASIGLLVECYVRIPNFEGRDELEVLGRDLNVIAPFILLCILATVELSIWTEEEFREPGDFGDPLGFGQYTEEWRNRELNNGRFAMFATTGILAAQLYTGKNAIEQLGL
eukprot:CAMPEP_0178436890 /NCGR_PEP_ID=MMETSP0689_2-20121128/34678_1 /TAXON_ID=160604 /ORGANISM="Amphidinium massartii, Strain CS-259" /LENGTH=270 /DNA_ID=CAMNT_0020059011 /DNA_START=23 /DNA_END=835 /DNA_ORIENTATION=+